MSEQMMGVDYFSLATDMKDDDKVFELKYRYGFPDGAQGFDHMASWAAFGRLIDLLSSIYQVGFVVKVTRQFELRMSQQWGMSLAELREFIETCVEVGLFDKGVWERDRALTSHGIQRRYFHAVKRRKGGIPKDLEYYLLIDAGGDIEAPESGAPEGDGALEGEADANTMHAPCEHDVDTVHASCEHDAGTMSTFSDKEKKRTGKERTGKKRKGKASSSLQEDGEGAGSWPYPLACMSLASGDGEMFADAEGAMHDSPWDALRARFVQRTGTDEMSDFVRKVAKACPAGCRGDPEQVAECFELLSSALDRFDRARCASPVPLALKVLEDRGKRDG